jgi:hypothetical protein
LGHVEISGKVNAFQYWPHGSSDVDTLSFIPDLSSAQYFDNGASTPVGAFFERGGIFQPDDNNPGSDKFRSILRKAGGKAFSIRIQGIDAPELHYSPNYREGMFDGDYGSWLAKYISRQNSYRQPYGKLCSDLFATAVRTQLGIGSFDPNKPEVIVDATVRLVADSINTAVDVYGRLIGYVTLSANSSHVILNDFALSQGFAFCSFYSNMTVDEMKRLSDVYSSHGTGETPISQLRSNTSTHLRDFEPSLYTTKSMRDTDRDDNRANSFRSKCFDPKLFRRCIDWVGRREALSESISLLDYMRRNDEDIALINDFISANGDWRKVRKLDMGALIAKDGSISYHTGEVVFESRPVVIVDEQNQPLPDSFLTPYP